MITIIFNVVAVIAIIFIIWWFWIAKAKTATSTSNEITIKVGNGAYDPSRIEVMANKPVTLNFLRTDASPCSEYVVFEELDIHEQLPLNETHAIQFNSIKPGTYRFTCQMGMYQGELKASS